jgi:hypothetical protein
MKQFLWKAVLFEPKEFQRYSQAVDRGESLMFKTEKDEPLIGLELRRVLLSEQSWC